MDLELSQEMHAALAEAALAQGVGVGELVERVIVAAARDQLTGELQVMDSIIAEMAAERRKPAVVLPFIQPKKTILRA